MINFLMQPLKFSLPPVTCASMYINLEIHTNCIFVQQTIMEGMIYDFGSNIDACL